MKCFLNVVSMKYNFFSGYITKLSIMGSAGMLNIYPNHTPLLTSTPPGFLYILTHSKKKIYLYISNGILEVQPMLVNIILEKAILGNNLNYNILIQEKENINKMLKKKSGIKNILNQELHIINLKLNIIKMMQK